MLFRSSDATIEIDYLVAPAGITFDLDKAIDGSALALKAPAGPHTKGAMGFFPMVEARVVSPDGPGILRWVDTGKRFDLVHGGGA